MAKRYYWLKLHRDFFKRHDTRIIEAMENGEKYLLFYMKLLVESIDHEGSLRFSDTIPYNDSMLATITNTDVDIVRSAVKVFVELDMMERYDDGSLFMAQVENMIGDETDWAQKKRDYRKRIADTTETIEDNVRQELDLDLDLEKEIEKKKTRAKARHPTLDVPMNQARYDSLSSTFGKVAVDDAIQSRIDWENTKGKPKARDYASAAANWMKTTGVEKLPGAGLRTVDMNLHPPVCDCGGKPQTLDGLAMCKTCGRTWDLIDGAWAPAVDLAPTEGAGHGKR